MYDSMLVIKLLTEIFGDKTVTKAWQKNPNLFKYLDIRSGSKVRVNNL